MDSSSLSLSTMHMALSISNQSHLTSTQLLHRPLKCFPYGYNSPTSSPGTFSALALTKRRRFRWLSASAASGDVNSKGADELSALSSEVVVLDVGGMMCEGCAASVKRLLESQPQVSSASVNLTTETATVWPVSEAKTVSNWHNQLGGALAEHLTNCGFKSSLSS